MGRSFILSLLLLIFSSHIIFSIHGKCLNDQRSNLLRFKYGLNIDLGDAYKLVSWNINKTMDCCKWGGVRCDVLGRVVSLDLADQSISIRNQHWTSLFNLTDLKEVYLDNVNISAVGSAWCDVFSSLSKLHVLSLSGCSLSGPICSSLLNPTSLTVLNLDFNNLSSSVPDSLANFSNLATLKLEDCDLRGRFPEKVFQIPTLEMIDLSFNYVLKGSLPEFQDFQSLKEVRCRCTSFSGSLPNSIGNVRALARLDLSASNFSGTIPITLGNLSELEYLDLSENKLHGSVPWFQMCKNLAAIDLSANFLDGPISSSHFEGLPHVYLINLTKNSLSGSLPTSLFALPSISWIYVSYNHFEGFEQESLMINASSSSLSEVDLRFNQIRGFIPKFFFDLQRFQVLLLSFNSFTGNISLEMFQSFKNLWVFELSHNYLSVDASCNGTCLSSAQHIVQLGLASCNLKQFPDHIKGQSFLYFLDLSSNFIAGEIPNWLWYSRLGRVNLSWNRFQDFQKPYTFDYLVELDVHANLLRGEMPLPSPSIVYLDYSNNRFNTSIPPNFGDYISGSIFLSLSNNLIIGDIPDSICNASLLEVLDLSHNSLRGRIPTCLFEMMDGSMSVLILRGNKLQGLIPSSFRDSCGLKTLDISRNALKGMIPESLSNCKYLEALNVGNNYLEDRFPCKLISNRPNLRILILRSNRFHGEISCSWIDNDLSLPSLQIMDIAYNNFSGFLPGQLFLNFGGMMVEHLGTKTSQPLEYLVSQGSEDIEYFPSKYYMDSVDLIIKGEEQELVKILIIYTALDFSCNNFQGKIPDAVGELRALFLLNFSHNSLTGGIPTSIGKLAQLGALDLSVNKLTGEIPANLENLNSLGSLNLSYNQLVGKIPEGNHFQTFPESSFLGNKELCGKPLNLSCINGSSSPPPISLISSKNEEIDWEYIIAALGFSFGLGIILLLNCFSPRWWQRFVALVLYCVLRVLSVNVQERLY